MGLPFEEYQWAAAEETAVKRVGIPSDIANAVSFLVAEDSGFVSGQVIYMTGGPVD